MAEALEWDASVVLMAIAIYHNLQSRSPLLRFPSGCWLTDKSFSNHLLRPALQVRAHSSKSSVGFAFPKGRGLQETCNPFQRVSDYEPGF